MTQYVKQEVCFAIKIKGFLGHDNKLWDRTCPNCRGMYSSYQMSVCPKCGQPLTWITTSDGKPMAVSEGTIYPAIGKEQEGRDAKAIANRKNGISPIYRFKVFSFADNNGVLAPPPEHSRLRTGALVEIITINHQAIPSWFTSKDKQPRLELMLMIYPQYGDTVKVLKDKEIANTTVTYPTDVNGNPTTLNNTPTGDNISKEIDKLRAQIDALTNTAQPNTKEGTATMRADDGTELPAELIAEQIECPFTDEDIEESGYVDVFNL